MNGILCPIFPRSPKNVWIVDGPSVRDMGVMFTTRMTVVRLSNGSLWVESPVAVPFDTLKRITELGPVRLSGCGDTETCLATDGVARPVPRGGGVGAASHSIYVEERRPAIQRRFWGTVGLKAGWRTLTNWLSEAIRSSKK